jgi:hypothetical protein
MRFDRNLWVNLGLVALALSTALILFLSRDRVTRDEREARPNNLIPVFRPEQLTRVVVERGKDSLVLAVRASADAGPPRYLLGSAEAIEADPEAARSFLRALELSSFLRRLEAEGADRATLGLAAPRARIRLEFRGLSGEILVGKLAAAARDESYVEVRGFGGEPSLGLVRSSALDELLLTEDSLRPRWLLSYGPAELAQFSVQEGDAAPLIFSKAGPAFRVANGPRVDRKLTDRLLLELSRARIVRVANGIDALFSRSGALRAEFRPVGQRPLVSFELGGPCPGEGGLLAFRRLSPQPINACVEPGVRGLFAELSSPRADEAVFALHADEVESVVVERDGKRLAFRRSPKGFELEVKGSPAVELDAGNHFLESLLAVQGQPVSAPDFTALGLTPASGTVRLVSSAIEGIARYEERVELGRPRPGGELPLVRSHDGAVLLVSAEAARAFTSDGRELRSRRLLDFGPSELQTLELEWPGGRERLRRTDSGVFELLEPRGFEHDPELLLALLQRLGTLEADRWASATDGGQFGLTSPSLRVRATLNRPASGPSPGASTEPSGAATAATADLQLTVGAETSGGYFGALEGVPGVFVLPKAFVHDASTWLLDRSVFVVDLSRFDAIELELGSRRLKLERLGDGFAPKTGSPELAPAMIERLLATLTTLRAEAALHLGPARAGEGFENPALKVSFSSARAAAETRVVRFGAESSFRGTSIRFARRSGVDATYGVLASSLREVLEAL